MIVCAAVGPMDRRRFLSLLSKTAGAGALTPWLISCQSDESAAVSGSSPAGADGGAPALGTVGPRDSSVPSVLVLDDGRIFDLSVASANPSATGVILWTHVNPAALVAGQPLAFQVGRDPQLATLALEGQIPAEALAASSDFTVRIDLDGKLAAGTYFYRFIYGDRASRVGRCRTLPAAGIASLRLALVTCQDFTNGYYETFRHLADDDVDFVFHLGDFIYESAGDPRFQKLPFDDRRLILPSNQKVAMDLVDYRALYRTYRGDPNLQRTLERHTFIFIPDDHETANDCYWDYARDTLGAPDHPKKDDVAAMRQLKLDSQRAWTEYAPARVAIDPTATHPHRFLRSYRSFDFGDLFRYVALDDRTYRSPHPCGEGDVFQRYVPIGCNKAGDPMRTMLGPEQRDWMLDRLAASGTLWKVLGNQTFFGPLKLAGGVPVNTDAWDGFEAERRFVAEQVRDRGVDNFVILTGDLHSYLASTVKVDYGAPADTANLIGVEFMTPSVTSAALFDLILQGLGQSPFASGLSEGAIRAENPHIKFFNSAQHGYSVLTIDRAQCEWIAYAIDKNVASGAERKTLARFRKAIGASDLIELPV
jgi:alkaline phosphatase D